MNQFFASLSYDASCIIETFPRKFCELCRSLAAAILEVCAQHIRKVNHSRHPAHNWPAAVHGSTRNEILVTWVSRSTCGVQCILTRIFHQSSETCKHTEQFEWFHLHQECIGVGKQLSKIASLAVYKRGGKYSPCIHEKFSKAFSQSRFLTFISGTGLPSFFKLRRCS